MKRKAPKGGYNFHEKKLYRHAVWKQFATVVGPLEKAQVLLMPSAEGEEIRVARQYGVNLTRMHLVDANPGIIASLRRRWGPGFHGYGVPLREASKRVAASGVKLSAANFDLTSPIGRPLWEEIQSVDYSMFAEKSAIAITILRARESGISGDLKREFIELGTRKEGDISPEDTARLMFVQAALIAGLGTDWPGGTFIPGYTHHYSSSSPMLSIVFLSTAAVCDLPPTTRKLTFKNGRDWLNLTPGYLSRLPFSPLFAEGENA